MQKQISSRLKRALQVFESGELDLVVKKGRPEDFEALRSLVSMDAEPEHCQRAIYALGRWGDQSAVPDVVSILPQLDENARITAVDALGRLGSREAQSAVESCADDPSPEVRKFVVQALGRLGGADAESRLRSMARRDSEGWIRSLAEQVRQSRK